MCPYYCILQAMYKPEGKLYIHDDVIKWKHFPRNWPFVREIHRSPVNFTHKGQWRGALIFSLIYPWINDWVNNREAGDLRRQHGHYDVIVMIQPCVLDWYPIRYTANPFLETLNCFEHVSGITIKICYRLLLLSCAMIWKSLLVNMQLHLMVTRN